MDAEGLVDALCPCFIRAAQSGEAEERKSRTLHARTVNISRSHTALTEDVIVVP
jgi:hypothetical protein